MRASELLNKSESELKEDLHLLQRKGLKLRFVKSGGEMTQTHEIRQVRRDIARINTRLSAIKGDK